jgi:hypothetical protein
MSTSEQDRSGPSRVRWLGRAEEQVLPDLKPRLNVELEQVFLEQAGSEITVHTVFAAFHAEPAHRIILGVEVRSADRYQTHIVKLGNSDVVNADYKGWGGCAAGRYIGSRIFVRLHAHDLPDGRTAVVYEDAYTLFGLDPKTQQPEFLEEVAKWAILDDKPDPVSVERVLCQIFGDLHRWFFVKGRADANAAKAFFTRRLAKALPKWRSPSDRRLATLRSDAVWLLGGLDTPDSQEPAVYLDPYDYVHWALENNQLPPTLVGCSHGDLHGRNILVGVRRGEAEFPIVIDYGEMDRANVLMWDFVKLETELKTRILPHLFKDSEVVEALRDLRSDQPPRREFPLERVSLNQDELDRAERAQRLALVYEFEYLLARATNRIASQLAAESREPPGGRPLFAANRKVDRALSIFLRIRQEAALWLGYLAPGRHTAWHDEYLFALAVCGLNTIKWPGYDPEQIECALVSAGKAVAEMKHAQRVASEQIESKTRPPRRGPSYRPSLAHAHRLLNASRLDDADLVMSEARDDFPDAVPLLTEYALVLAEQRPIQVASLDRSLAIVEPLQRLCWVFGDHETLTRIGRSYKNLGDRAWEGLGPPFGPIPTGTFAWQLFSKAFNLYEDAFIISSGDHFPGVNAATLALLTGDVAAARDYAGKVLAACRSARISARGEALYWILVSEGEAALLAAETALARDFYSNALNLVGPAHVRMAKSSWDQLCRLWCALGERAVGPVVDVFRNRSALWKELTRGPLSDCDFDGARC